MTSDRAAADSAAPGSTQRRTRGRNRAGVVDGLVGAYRDAFAGSRVAWASPVVFAVGSFAGFYIVGLAVAHPSQPLLTLVGAVLLGLAGLVIGIGAGWSPIPRPAGLTAVGSQRLLRFGLALVVVGVVALAFYFLAIGYLPLFQPGLEDARVVAAETGGAPLRVLSLLSLIGTWIVVAVAAARRSGRLIAAAVVIAMLVAVGHGLTGNRSPAFSTIEVSITTAVLARGWSRLGHIQIGALVVVGVALLIAAGVFGAFRLASRADIYGPPSPYAVAPNYVVLTGVAIRGYLVVPVQNLDYTMQAVPSRIGWRLGSTYLQPLITVLPGKQTTFDADLKAALGQRFAGGGTVPGLLGEAYANFGPLGWFIVPLVVGAALTILYRRLDLANPAHAALYGYALTHVSIGGVLSGLAAANPFPYEAYAVLGFAAFGLPRIDSLIRRTRK
jgi:oligosaccharide repeat unit polymerase